MDILRRLAEMGGAARRQDLVGGSTGGRRLVAHVAAGEVVDHGGCYALPHAPCWLVRARQFRGSLTCVSWALEEGLPLLARPTRVHLAVPASRSPSVSPARPTSSVVLHRSAAIAPGPTAERPVVPPVVAAATILRCVERLAAVVAVDAVLNRGLCSRQDIERQLVGPGRDRAMGALSLCDPRSESVLESVARVVLRAAGLAVQCNVVISGVGRVDLLVEDRLVVELDGFEHHGSRRAFVEDRRRDRILVGLGFVVLRFTYEDVLASQDAVTLAVRRALDAPIRPRWT